MLIIYKIFIFSEQLQRTYYMKLHYFSINNTPSVPGPQCDEITPPALVSIISLKMPREELKTKKVEGFVKDILAHLKETAGITLRG